jgi:hypothetical protein
LTSAVCSGDQGDIIMWDDVLVRSLELHEDDAAHP